MNSSLSRKKVLMLILSLSCLLPITLNINALEVTAAAEDIKIGFTWINGPTSSPELYDVGYNHAVEMGGQIEHRSYGWGDLTSNWQYLMEWKTTYLDTHPELASSVSIAVINSNTTNLPANITIERYTTPPAPDSNVTRFNDPFIIEQLQNFTDFVVSLIPDLQYISYGAEINDYFETFYDFESEYLTSSAMLDDYIDLCENMYDYIQNNYPNITVLTIFRNQRAEVDIKVIEEILPSFVNTCDVYAFSARIFTTPQGYLAQLTTSGIINRVQEFVDLCGDKKFAITNMYMISEARAGGGGLYQASFVSAFFQLTDEYSEKLEFLCWYTLFDYPPGYLQTIVNPYLEIHSTAGLLTLNGDPKPAYYQWINEMKARNRIPSYTTTWKIVVASLILAAIIAFITFTFVMEGLDFSKEKESDEPEVITFTKKKEKKK
ncbi:MAG: hypothetical protein U9O98_08730 [Asgard group archaeon]|nr:hypothetical protein [Asgard group archaeon]